MNSRLIALVTCGLVAVGSATSMAADTPPADPLYQKILALDTEMFDAFNTCTDPAKLEKRLIAYWSSR